MMKFYGYTIDWGGESYNSITFFNSIEDIIFKVEIDNGTIRQYGSSTLSPPLLLEAYDVSTIEDYELFEYLNEYDMPEMNPDNYIVFTRGDDGYENMLTIVRIGYLTNYFR